MKFITDPIVKTSKEFAALATRVYEGGVGFLKTTWNSIPVFAGAKAHVGLETKHDETHYFLIPYRVSKIGFALGTTRVLPEGVGPENDLPKRRIFHLPGPAGEDTLRRLLSREIAGRIMESADTGSDTAEWLERICNEIDNKAALVTGGILLIGGAVAIANPVAGVAIAGKALLPSIGMMFSREGLKGLAGKFRSRQKSRVEASANREADKEVKLIRAEVRENAILVLLDRVLSEPDGEFDPALEALNLPTDIPHMLTYAITAEAILNAYREILGNVEMESEARLGRVGAAWVKGLGQYLDD